jgi:hypothetical protein
MHAVGLGYWSTQRNVDAPDYSPSSITVLRCAAHIDPTEAWTPRHACLPACLGPILSCSLAGTMDDEPAAQKASNVLWWYMCSAVGDFNFDQKKEITILYQV